MTAFCADKRDTALGRSLDIDAMNGAPALCALVPGVVPMDFSRLDERQYGVTDRKSRRMRTRSLIARPHRGLPTAEQDVRGGSLIKKGLWRFLR